MRFGFLLNTLDKKFDLRFEHFALVWRLRQSGAYRPTQCFLVIVSPYLNQQLRLSINQTIGDTRLELAIDCQTDLTFAQPKRDYKCRRKNSILMDGSRERKLNTVGKLWMCHENLT